MCRWLAALSMCTVSLVVDSAAHAQSAKPGWELTFNDEFTGTGVDAQKWQKRYKWGEAQINAELQAYVDDAFQLDGDILHIVGQHSPGQYAGMNFDYRSGLIASIFHQKYGWFETRCRMPTGQGLWPAFWLLGETGTTGVNEIDIHEYIASIPNTVYMTVHWGQSYTSGHQSDGQSYAGPNFSADYHTFAVDWDADRIIWYVDDIERFRHTGAGVPAVEMYVIANLAIGGSWPGAPDATTIFPADYDIDYIRVYRKLQGTGDAGNGALPDAAAVDASATQPDSGQGPDTGTGGQSGSNTSTKISGSGITSGCSCRLMGIPVYSARPWVVLLGLGLLLGRRRNRLPLPGAAPFRPEP